MKFLMVTLLVAYAAAVVAQQPKDNPRQGLTEWGTDEGILIPRYPANGEQLSEAGKNLQSLPITKNVQDGFDYIKSLEQNRNTK